MPAPAPPVPAVGELVAGIDDGRRNAHDEGDEMARTTVVPFDAEQWVEEEPGVRARVREDAGDRWAIVEYAPGAGRSGWCEVAHHVYVVSGEIEYELQSGAKVVARAGQGLFLGADDAHRGANRGGEPARLVVIDLGGH